MTDRKAAAVEEARRLIETEGLSANKAAAAVGAKIGVTGRTVAQWAQDAGESLGDSSHEAAKQAREVAEAEHGARRAKLRLRLLSFTEGMLDRAEGADKSLDARNWSWCAAVMIDKMRLEEGKATGRTETVPVDEAARVLREFVAEAEEYANQGGE